MRKEYDFSKARKNPFAVQLNERIIFANISGSKHISSSVLVDQIPKPGADSQKMQLPSGKERLA